MKKLFLKLIVLISLFSLTAYAEAKQNCFSDVRVTGVIQGYYSWGDARDVGIQITDSDGNIHYAATLNAWNVGSNPEARTLLQLAMLAYVTQHDVDVVIDGDCSGPTSGGIEWIDHWVGLVLGDDS